jgi:hypothetical protein
LKKDGTEPDTFEWAQVEGVPCKLVQETEGHVVLQSFTSDPASVVRVPRDELAAQFVQAEMDGEFILGVKYPGGRLHVSEFDKRKEATALVAKAIACLNVEGQDGKTPLQEKLSQLPPSQGSTKCATFTKYFDYMSGRMVLGPTKDLGDPVFNRSKRWAPPVDIDRETFKQTRGFPAPLGIRPKDFCLPSEMTKSVTELLVQMACFENAPPALVAFVSTIPGVVLPDCVHCCKWCDETIDADQIAAQYKSKTNYAEICHRDPNAAFSPGNMYWGHGDCNRRQGGYDEGECVRDGLRLFMTDPAGYMLKFPLEVEKVRQWVIGNSV